MKGYMARRAAILLSPRPFNELLIVSGQSNGLALGVSSVPVDIAAIDTRRVKIWNGAAFVGYVAGTNSEPTGAYPTKWGPEAQYAVRWLAAHRKGTLYIVKRAVSGSLASTWVYGQTNFNNQTAWVTAAKAALAGTPIAKQNVVWVQGEADAIVDQATADAYRAKLVGTLSDIRTYWAMPTSRVAIMRIYRSGMAYGATVRASQDAVAVADPLSSLVVTDDLALVDTYHYNNAGMQAIGSRMFDALMTGAPLVYESASSLPAMTAANAPVGYVASASNEFSSAYAAWRAFDKSFDQTNGRFSTANGLSTGWLMLQVPAAIKLAAFRMTTWTNPAYGPPAMTLDASNDGAAWTTIASYSGLTWAASETKHFDIPAANRGLYTRYRWNFTGATNGYTSTETELLAELAA